MLPQKIFILLLRHTAQGPVSTHFVLNELMMDILCKTTTTTKSFYICRLVSYLYYSRLLNRCKA